MPNAQQQLNALNPTPVTINTPTDGLYRGLNDNSTIYKKGTDGSMTALNLAAGGDNNTSKYGLYSAGTLGVGNQQAQAIANLKSNYGIDINSLPSFNTADLGTAQGFSGNLNDFFGTKQMAGSQSQVLNGPGTGASVQADLTKAQAIPQAQASQDALNQTKALQGSHLMPGDFTAAPQQTQTTQPPANLPTQNLQPGMQGDQVKALQDYLVKQGLMTQDQVNTGYGIYGPQTTAAVAALQQKLGVDNSSGPGYFGPKTIAALQGSSPQSQAPQGQSPQVPPPQQGTPQPQTPSQSTPDPYQAALAEYQKNLATSPEETAAQAALDKITAEQANVNASSQLGQVDAQGQPIAQSFITGQTAQMQRLADAKVGALAAQSLPLTQQLARAQARRQSAIDVAKSSLDSVKYQQQSAAEAAKTKFDEDLATKNYQLNLSNTNADNTLASQRLTQDQKQFDAQLALDRQKAQQQATQSGGLSSTQVTAFNNIANKYNASPLVQAADRTIVLKNTIDQVRKDPSNGALQLNLVYSYVQALDTYQSAVREGELSLVNSVDSKIGQLSNSVQQIQNGQIVRPEVAKQIADAASSLVTTINDGAKAKAKSFESQASAVGLGSTWNTYIGGFNQSYNSSTGTSGSSSTFNAASAQTKYNY